MFEEIARTDADVEMFGAGARFEEGEKDVGGGAAPDEGVAYADDEDVVEEAEDERSGVDSGAGGGV